MDTNVNSITPPPSWVETQEMLSDYVDVPVKWIRRAKKMKCPAFRVGGRIDVQAFKDWWAVHQAEVMGDDEDTLTKWKTRKTKADAMMAELELEEMKKRSIDIEDVVALLRHIATAQKAMMVSKLVNELPPKTIGLDVVRMAVANREAIEEVCKVMQDILADYESR
jgi:phage terminase Nu1 subunit (DNA packaging protein)